MNEGILVIVQDFIAIEVITLLDNFFGHLVLTILQQNHTFLLGNEPDDNLTDIDHGILVNKHGLPPDMKRGQFKLNDASQLGKDLQEIMRKKKEYKDKNKSLNAEVLPYNVPSERKLNKATLDFIEGLNKNSIIDRIRIGYATTRLDVVIFEIVNFFFTIFFFYISPFIVINLPMFTNGLI